MKKFLKWMKEKWYLPLIAFLGMTITLFLSSKKNTKVLSKNRDLLEKEIDVLKNSSAKLTDAIENVKKQEAEKLHQIDKQHKQKLTQLDEKTENRLKELSNKTTDELAELLKKKD